MITSFRFSAIGTHWSIDIYEKISDDKKQIIEQAIHKTIDQFDKNYSRFRNDSLVTHWSKNLGRYELPNDAEPMLDLYQKLYKITDGLMTPLIGQVLVDAGYDTNYSLKQKNFLTPPPSWDEAIDYQFPFLEIKKEILLDFGACGKGYLVDLVSSVLREHHVTRFCVDAGGDIFHYDVLDEPIRIGLENPENIDQVIAVVALNNASIAGSAGNRRVWQGFTHIINPKTLLSPRTVLAIWVVAETCVLADALATALSFCSADKLREHFEFDYLIMKSDHSVSGTLVGHPNVELFA